MKIKIYVAKIPFAAPKNARNAPVMNTMGYIARVIAGRFVFPLGTANGAAVNDAS
jgi:hypothetical protein